MQSLLFDFCFFACARNRLLQWMFIEEMGLQFHTRIKNRNEHGKLPCCIEKAFRG